MKERDKKRETDNEHTYIEQEERQRENMGDG
jgi:hypothetical protein